MDFYFETEAQDRLKRIENGEDIQKICDEIIYDPYENKVSLPKVSLFHNLSLFSYMKARS